MGGYCCCMGAADDARSGCEPGDAFVYPCLSGTMRFSATVAPRNVKVLRAICDTAIPQFMLAPGMRIEDEYIDTTHGRLRLEWLLPAEAEAFNPELSEETELSSSGHSRSSSCRSIQAGDAPMKPRRIMLYMHGGAYVLCTPGSLRGCTSPVARWLGAAVCVPDYRRPPESCISDAIQDGIETYRHLLRTHPDAEILLGGESAGGGLAASMSLAMRDGSDPLPKGIFLMSPWTDLSGEGDQAGVMHCDLTQQAADYLPLSLVTWIALQARCNLPTDRPPASPMYAEGSLAQLPPILVLYGKAELLCKQIEHFCERWTQKGARLTPCGVVGGIHAPVLWNFCHGPSLESLDDLKDFFDQIGREGEAGEP